MSKREAPQDQRVAKKRKIRPLSFSFKTSDMFKNICKALNGIIVEANFEFENSGLSMQKMDAAHVCLASLNIHKDLFKTYRCDVTRTFGAKMEDLAKMMALVKKDDKLKAVERSTQTKQMIRFNFEGIWKSWHDIAEYEIEEEMLGIPDTDYETTIEMRSADFKNLVNKFSTFADTVRITTTENDVRWSTESEENHGESAGVIMEVSDDENKSVKVTTRGRSSSVLSLRYLKLFSACATVSPSLRIDILSGVPLRFTFPLDENESLGSVRLYLAPKIDDADI